MNADEYPQLYSAASDASLAAQKSHFGILIAYLGLMGLASFLSVYSYDNYVVAIIIITIFLCTLGLTILQAYKRYDKIWYNGRAVAESIKTRSWRFMMCAEPYNNPNNMIMRSEFRSELQEILRQNQALGSNLHQDDLGDSVTDRMNCIRELPWIDRLEVYRLERIDEQRKWYAQKAGYNKRYGRYWFYGLIAVHLLIIILMAYKIKFTEKLFPIDFLIFCAAAITSWIQAKKFQDLSTAYTLTAHEIGIIKGDSERTTNDQELSDFVKDAENAFSREHTQWYARKDN